MARLSADAATTEDNRSTAPDAPVLLPAHVIALMVLAVVAIVAAHSAAGAFREGQAVGAHAAELRRAVSFGLLFNVAIALALALAWFVEVVTGIVRVARGASGSRTLVRVALALLPAALFLAGHRIVNPWLPDLVRQLASMARGG